MSHDREVTVRGLRLHYTEQGPPTAPPVLLLHGITGHARTWDDEAAALAGTYRVLALDQRGHGDSDRAPDGDYTTAALAADLGAFVDALGLARLRLVGLSLGGRVAMAWAGSAAARVERLVIVDIGPDIAPAGRARVGTAMASAPERFATADEAFAWMRAGNPRYTAERLRHRVAHGLRTLSDGGLAWKYDRALREAVRAGRWRDTIDLWPAWRALACPTLLVRGADSDILTPDIAKQMLEALPHAHLVEVPEAGHTVPGDQPVPFLALLRDFLA